MISTKFSKTTKDNTGKPLPHKDDGEGVTAIMDNVNKGKTDAVLVLEDFANKIRSYGKREAALTAAIEDQEKTITALKEENEILKHKVAKVEVDPMTYIIDYVDKENLEYRYAKNPSKVFRIKDQGGQWITFPEIVSFREQLMKNTKSIKYKKLTAETSKK